jgi:hypothetical protein
MAGSPGQESQLRQNSGYEFGLHSFRRKIREAANSGGLYGIKVTCGKPPTEPGTRLQPNREIVE